MTQKTRLQEFVSQLLDKELTDSQRAMVLGADKKKEKSKVNNLKCTNSKSKNCRTNVHICTNRENACVKSSNTLQCSNS